MQLTCHTGFLQIAAIFDSFIFLQCCFLSLAAKSIHRPRPTAPLTLHCFPFAKTPPVFLYHRWPRLAASLLPGGGWEGRPDSKYFRLHRFWCGKEGSAGTENHFGFQGLSFCLGRLRVREKFHEAQKWQNAEKGVYFTRL